MKFIKSTLAVLLALATLLGIGVFSAFSAQTEVAETGASTGITIHYYHEGGVPYVYYWNALPSNLETAYPGVKMTADGASGANWYKYEFKNSTKINLMFTNGTNTLEGQLSPELTRQTGDWFYKNGKWKKSAGGGSAEVERGDFREESIYFVITTRFYDGDKGNNVHCWDDGQAKNPDSDPAWRGDFKGLAQKLDYIKALGFSAVWITPVVENASGYDYHGYHAFDFATVDPRYESSDFTYEDLIQAAHDKGMKIVQDVVWNHTGNFGEAFLGPLFTKEYKTIQDLADADKCMQVIPGSDLAKNYPNYASLDPGLQFQARLDCLKAHKTSSLNQKEYYHREKNMGYESSIEQQGSMAGDCVDLNTENPVVAKYITDTYMDYVNMGVDAFRLDTEKHINRWTLNSAYFPVFQKVENFYIFGEVCSRVRETWNHNIPSSSPAFFTWKETESAWIGNWDTSSPTANIAKSIDHYDSHRDPSGCPTSSNAYLNGLTYHKPDYSKANGTGIIDFTMHWNFENANNAIRAGFAEDSYINDSTWNVMYVDSHDYGPDGMEKTRYSLGTQAWAENLNLIFTFRGIPCVYYGSEIEFCKNLPIDVGPNAPLAETGRAYLGDHLEGTVTASDFSKYTASGKVQQTLESPLAKHIQKLNAIRRSCTALQKGQYTHDGSYVSGNELAFIRRYTGDGIDSLACVSITGGATFKGIPNGLYIDAVTGDKQTVSNGTLNVPSTGKGNMRVYVCCASGFEGINGPQGPSGQTYLK